MLRLSHLLPLLLLSTMLPACGDKDDSGDDSGHHHHHDDTDSSSDTQDVTLTFAARLGGADVACGQDAMGVGSSESTVQLQDLRLYVHDVRLVDTDGAEHAVALTEDGVWQHSGGVALLDFEDGTGLCANGNSPTNHTLVGTVATGSYTGLRFRVGVPFELNHADPTLADSPLNLTSLFWSWQSGYKFMRLDLSTAGLPGGWFFHLGSTGCTADEEGNVQDCASPNRPEVELTLDPAQQVVVLDLDALLAGTDVDTDAGGPQGCMSGVDDPECPALLEAVGLSGGTQVLFTVE